jgi:hypothetical protein
MLNETILIIKIVNKRKYVGNIIIFNIFTYIILNTYKRICTVFFIEVQVQLLTLTEYYKDLVFLFFLNYLVFNH